MSESTGKLDLLSAVSSPAMATRLQAAAAAGRSIDLSGCHYEPRFEVRRRRLVLQYGGRRAEAAYERLPRAVNWALLRGLQAIERILPRAQGEDEIPEYYHFLAGLVVSERLERILEIGTYFGGSSCALCRGISELRSPSARFVTIDIEERPCARLKSFPFAARVRGNSLDAKLVQSASTVLGGRADLLFLDSLHSFEHVYAEMRLYQPVLQPRFILLDDIHLNESMVRFWSQMQLEHGERAVDITAIAGRDPRSGFGLIWNGRE